MAKENRAGSDPTTEKASKASGASKPKTPFDLRTMVILAAWADPKFAELVQRDPTAAVAEIGKDYDIDLPQGMTFKTVQANPDEYYLFLLPHPAGDLKTVLREGEGGLVKGGGGLVKTVTADCYCPSTVAGSCGVGTVVGTPCYFCKTEGIACP